jgi:hypothetical protein
MRLTRRSFVKTAAGAALACVAACYGVRMDVSPRPWYELEPQSEAREIAYDLDIDYGFNVHNPRRNCVLT